MNKALDIIYRGYYDYPIDIIVSKEENSCLLSRRFDEANDEYNDFYDVFLLSKGVTYSELTSWLGIENFAVSCIGKIPIGNMGFDETRRKTISSASLDNLREI